ncbi:beta-glucosidase BglX [uncultured Bacteroides sp.]|uniref:beta-glucosidase BglX n=1 Tax=uncultured Bacteroides sp. TaxID=162156 RepID=UPI002AABA6DD|nr:beta-glucosidase BglX [uncultured Bacteroides sp.]
MLKLFRLNRLLALGLATFSLVSYGQSNKFEEQKITELLSKMTLQEKIGQMNQVSSAGLTDDMKGQIRSGKVGSILNELDAKTVNELQRIAIEESRLKIPLIIARDVIHGFKTIFPIPLGQAASWNLEIAKNGARIASLEATASGIRWTFAPMIDVARDPRWGRIAESCGEDPYLTSLMGEAMIKGFQGDNLNSPSSMAACAKHFAAYGASESGKDYNTTWIPESLLRETYLPPFEKAVKAGVATFMCSFNDINGVPSSGNYFLNKQILRNEWKYDGMLVSDWGSIEQMIPHGFCSNLKEATEKAVLARVDMDMMGYAYTNYLEELVRSGKVDEKILDESVRNILRLKFRLGLFKNPYTKIQTQMPYYLPESLQQAKEAAIESAILLKNTNSILPLSSSIKSVAVIGPLSDSPADQLGTWCFDAEPEHCITPLMAIRDTYGKKVQVIAEKGLTYSRDTNEKGIEKAVAAAQKADVILLFAGEEAVLSGEARCRADISLPGKQTELVTALKRTGKPLVVIVMAGRPLTIAKEAELADAMLYAFHGGTMAGAALADLIFGKAIPSGKLPVTLPRMVGQIPIYYAHKNTGRPASNITMINDIKVGAKQTSLGFTSYHLDAGDTPLFPFGYGLSYSTFNYSDIKLSSNTISEGNILTVSCDITNTGNYDANEVVQLYIRDKVGSLIRPVKELKGFEKVFIKANETHTVSFHITSEDLAYWQADMVKRPENGEFTVWIAPNSQSGKGADFNYQQNK